MKWNKQLIVTLTLFIVSAALYRVIPGRPYGFAPQISMALFGGAVVRDKKWAFALPLFSLFLSDLLYQVLYINHLTPIRGFYAGQWLNYLVLATVVVLGTFLKKKTVFNIASFSVLAPTWFFVLSNFTVWLGSDGVTIPLNGYGLLQTYVLGIPFYGASLWATLLFSALFFGVHYLVGKQQRVAIR